MSAGPSSLCDNRRHPTIDPARNQGTAVPEFKPFRGTTYNTERFGDDLSDLAAPPYDVIDEERREHLGAKHGHNAVHLTLPQDAPPLDRYEHAAQLWRDWRDEGTLVADTAPAFYVYRVTFEDDLDHVTRRTTGVIGALEVCPPGEGAVLPHERTMPKPRGDRLDLIRATRANLEPIWGLSLTAGLTALLAVDGPALATCIDTRGFRHELFRIAEPAAVAAITDAVAETPVVLADGHHRYETSLHYRDEQRAAGADAGGHDLIMTLIVELVEDQIAVQAIHRVVTDLPTPDALRTSLAERFEVQDVGPNEPDLVSELPRRMREAAAMALVDHAGVALVTPKPGALAEDLHREESELVHEVDAARFEAGVAPALEAAGATVVYRHDHAAVAEQVRKGLAEAAMLLRPVDAPTIRAVAEAGERMPQKTTFFHPKPSTGLVFRSLDD